MNSSPPRVAILILNWNDLRNTIETLSSVRGMEYPNIEVWVVNNGSTDESKDALARDFPKVRVLSSLENLGVAGGRNFGLEAILSHGRADYVLILDNDVAVEPRLLNKLVEAGEARADLGIVGPIIYYHSDPRRIWSAGARIVFREVTAKSPAKNRLEKAHRAKEIEQVDCITGCCMLVKRQVFDAIGHFNPKYFMVGNETEFCYRATKRGFRSAVVTDAKLWHKVSASTGGSYSPPRAYFTGRSTILFLKDHGRPWHWISTLTFAALSLPIAYLRERRHSNTQAVVMKIRGYLDGLLGRPVNPEVARYFRRTQSVAEEAIGSPCQR
ncbi:MAG: glycosyltransferase family 2 protein [bacterium]